LPVRKRISWLENSGRTTRDAQESSNVDLDLAILNPRWIRLDRTVRAIAAGAGLYIKTPSVQRAEDLVILETAGAEGAAPVRALIVKGVKLAVAVVEGELTAADMDGATVPGRKTGGIGDSDEFRHECALLESQISNFKFQIRGEAGQYITTRALPACQAGQVAAN